MTTLKEALDQLAKGHELDNEQKKLIIDKWQKELGTQPCDDCISRQAVHEAIERWAGSTSVLVALPTREVRPLLDSIHELPPVTPQPDTARRIIGKSRGGMTLWYQCEKCNEPIDVQDTFCSGCGRRLVE